MNFLREAEAKFDDNKPRIDQPDALKEVISSTKEQIRIAPDKESLSRLHSYLSEIYRQAEQYVDSFEAGKVGIESSETFFNHQSHNSILDSLFNLDRYQDFQTWVERALADKFPDANYYKIRYLTNLGKFDEALELCDSHYSSEPYFLNANRADILVKAKRFDEAEQFLNKLVAAGPRSEHTANWINTLAFSILMPQKRYQEAERILISAICTTNEREKINAFSNLAMLAYNMDEFPAAKRFASQATNHPDNPIASESRLTLCRIEYRTLKENEKATADDWKKLFQQVKAALEITDFDDAPSFLAILIESAEKSDQTDQIVSIVNQEFAKLRTQSKWRLNPEAANVLQRLRIDILSKHYLDESNFMALDELFTEALTENSDQGFTGLLDYLKTPFAAIDLRRLCLKITDKNFLADWAAFEKIEEILYGLAKNSEEPILIALAENTASPEMVCEVIAKKNDLDLDVALAGRQNLTDRMKALLAKSNFEPARKLIAGRSDLSDEVYTLLATDSALLVRDAIRENEACTPEIRALAALGSL